MKRKSKSIIKCIMTFVLAAAMLLGSVSLPLMQGDLVVYAKETTAYSEYLVTSTDSGQTLSDKVVKFNNYDWYIIADDSTDVDAGTVTLFATNNIGNSKFNTSSYYGNSYNGSSIKGYLDNLTFGAFYDMSDAIVSVDLPDVNVTGAKLWLLSTSEAGKLNNNIARCSGNWWLRSPSPSDGGRAFFVDGNNGGVGYASGLPYVDLPLGVRPALKLDLSKVEFNKTTKTFSALGQTVAVTNVDMEPSAPQTISVDDKVSFTASIGPDEATDKTVKWKIEGNNEKALKLYSDEACEKELGAEATEIMTVYAKGISTGNAIVTCISNSDSAKFASCEVTVNSLQAQTENLLTTVTPGKDGIPNYSVTHVAWFSGLYSSYYNEICGWNGTDMQITVDAVDGYTITRCIFYDDTNHIAIDSEAPFSVETPHLSSTPHVNGKPIYEGSKGIKRIDVIGHAGYFVSITSGNNMTKDANTGAALQTGLSGVMQSVVYTADDGYYFPEDYSVDAVNGISVDRDSYTSIKVSGTATADTTITLSDPTAKTKPDAPTKVEAVNCTTEDNNDGKLTGVTSAMEYKKSDADSWNPGTGIDITNLDPGTYYVRVKATDTTLASDNLTLTIGGYVAPNYTVTYKVINGTWSDDSTTDKTETVQSGSTPASVPTGMKAGDGYSNGEWDADPASTTITGATTFTYTFTPIQTYEVTYKVVNGTWSDDSATDKTETVQSGSTPANIPTGMKAGDGYLSGEWDTDPASTTITGAMTFTYTFAARQAATITKAPTEKKLTYNGHAQALIDAGLADGGEMQYALGNETEATEPYSASIPTGIDAGTYYVWYKVKGDASHNDIKPDYVEAKINPVDKTDLNTAIEAAKEFYDSIKNMDIYAQVATPLNDAIATAEKTVESDKADETTVSDAITTINKAKADAEMKKKDADDNVAANAVKETINALPAIDKIATTDKAAVEAARKVFDTLTEDQKAKISAETLKKLEDIEKALEEAEKDAEEALKSAENKKDEIPEKKYKYEWVDGLWYNIDGTQTYEYKGEWKTNGTGWWFETESGWYPIATWQKIDGKWYYFDASGYMASNEWVDGYWLSGNGAWEYQYIGSWKTNGSGWWFEDESGWYPSSQWQRIDGKWYYFGSDGIMLTNQYVGDCWVGSDGSWQ